MLYIQSRPAHLLSKSQLPGYNISVQTVVLGKRFYPKTSSCPKNASVVLMRICNKISCNNICENWVLVNFLKVLVKDFDGKIQKNLFISFVLCWCQKWITLSCYFCRKPEISKILPR